jgi:antitoxin (DNA-binding transcriptional repressor) of toxin-antitoxin stability system
VEASIVDLRYRTKEVLRALERNETVEILYHGKLRGRIVPPTRSTRTKVEEHPFFGMRRDAGTVAEEMDSLRGGRHRAV